MITLGCPLPPGRAFQPPAIATDRAPPNGPIPARSHGTGSRRFPQFPAAGNSARPGDEPIRPPKAGTGLPRQRVAVPRHIIDFGHDHVRFIRILVTKIRDMWSMIMESPCLVGNCPAMAGRLPAATALPPSVHRA